MQPNLLIRSSSGPHRIGATLHGRHHNAIRGLRFSDELQNPRIEFGPTKRHPHLSDQA
jgi:hypothetical protein